MAAGANASIEAEQKRGMLESLPEVSEVEIDAKDRIIRMKWEGSFEGIKALEPALSADGLVFRILNPMRFELKLAPKNGGALKAEGVAAAFKKAGCVKMTAGPDGTLEAWTTRVVTLKYLQTLRDAATALSADLEIASHEVVSFDGDFSAKKDEAKQAAKTVQGALYVDVQPGKVSILARKGEVGDAAVLEAFRPLGVAVKKAGA